MAWGRNKKSGAPKWSQDEYHKEFASQIREQINQILAERSGQDLERIRTDTERDFFLSAEDAREYGLIDEIITPSRLALSEPAEAAG